MHKIVCLNAKLHINESIQEIAACNNSFTWNHSRVNWLIMQHMGWTILDYNKVNVSMQNIKQKVIFQTSTIQTFQ